jgi:hypothetical protein
LEFWNLHSRAAKAIEYYFISTFQKAKIPSYLRKLKLQIVYLWAVRRLAALYVSVSAEIVAGVLEVSVPLGTDGYDKHILFLCLSDHASLKSK